MAAAAGSITSPSNPAASAGIGLLLMNTVEQRMLAMGVVKINLQVRGSNLKVCTFYEKIGYKNEQLTSFGKWLKHK